MRNSLLFKAFLSFFTLSNLFTALSCQAQSHKTGDIIYLRNGSILRGKIISQNPDSSIRLRMADKSEWVFSKAEVMKTGQAAVDKDYSLWDKKYYSALTMGPLLGENVHAVSGFSFNMVAGYRFNSYAALGIVTGFDAYDVGLVIPVGLDFRGVPLHSTVSPYYFGQLGAGLPSTGSSETDYVPQLMAQLGMGTQFRLAPDCAFTISCGYKVQRFTTEYESWIGLPVVEKLTLRRLSVAVGFLF